MEKYALKASKKRPIPSPSAGLLDPHRARCECECECDYGGNDSEVPATDRFPADRYLADKQASLSEPFEVSGGDSTLTHTIKTRVAVRPPTAEKEFVAGDPLSSEAVADLLGRVKPDCHKAQAWIKEHGARKAAIKRANPRLEYRIDLRRNHVLQSHDGARRAGGQFDVPRYQIRAPMPSPEVPGGRTVEEELEEARVVYNRVNRAHDRLLKTIVDMEEFRKTLS
ncbi:hypothetical protein BDV26DRAFT_292424 [Aspergillus bertholletiae]|uniref:Uncharacterized protein n=1 Tax=Aspergillus bertholletiae TaxID=1226010 RepID=A0A5N7B8V3_9EURO|nr:hypothetical protein BDV26DRAFT_292424 [Aspergillus bertholletiae]